MNPGGKSPLVIVAAAGHVTARRRRRAQESAGILMDRRPAGRTCSITLAGRRALGGPVVKLVVSSCLCTDRSAGPRRARVFYTAFPAADEE
jgi:hypothetical protein